MESGVYNVVFRSYQMSTGDKVIGTRRVDTNKGDPQVPDLDSLEGNFISEETTIYMRQPFFGSAAMGAQFRGHLAQVKLAQASLHHDQRRQEGILLCYDTARRIY